MNKRLLYIFLSVLSVYIFSGCTSIQKESYDDVLIPIVTVIPYGSIIVDGEVVLESELHTEEQKEITPIPVADDSVDNTMNSDGPEDNQAAENNNNTDSSEMSDDTVTSASDGEEITDDGTDNNAGDDGQSSEEPDISLLSDDGFSYDLTSKIVYNPKKTYSAEEISQLYLSEDRFAVFKALSGKKVKKLSDEEFAVLAPTSRMSFEELVGDNGVYNGYPEAFPYAGTYKLVVDLNYQIVTAYIKDAEGEYTIPVRYMKCSSGGSGNNTPDGLFKMSDYRVRFSLFNSTKSYAQYWSLIFGRIYFHSILYSRQDASSYTSSSYNNLGKACSNGCIRLCVPDARWIWYNIAPDTPCEIKYGTDDDTEIKAVKKRLKLADIPDERADLKMGEIPWTDNWTVEEVPQEQPFVNGSQD